MTPWHDHTELAFKRALQSLDGVHESAAARLLTITTHVLTDTRLYFLTPDVVDNVVWPKLRHREDDLDLLMDFTRFFQCYFPSDIESATPSWDLYAHHIAQSLITSSVTGVDEEFEGMHSNHTTLAGLLTRRPWLVTLLTCELYTPLLQEWVNPGRTG